MLLEEILIIVDNIIMASMTCSTSFALVNTEYLVTQNIFMGVCGHFVVAVGVGFCISMAAF